MNKRLLLALLFLVKFSGGMQSEIEMGIPKGSDVASKVSQSGGCFGMRMKKALNFIGLGSLTVLAEGYRFLTNEQIVPLLVAYAVGKSMAEITERYKYYKKILASMVAWFGGGMLYWFDIIDLEVVAGVIIMYMIYTTFEEYAKATGRRNRFTESFKDLPGDLQSKLVSVVSNVAEKMKNIGHSKLEDEYADVELGLLT